jgi:hypothetical protein
MAILTTIAISLKSDRNFSKNMISILAEGAYKCGKEEQHHKQ